MFKAKLIESSDFYTYRKRRLVYILLPELPLAVFINFYQVPVWATVLAIVVYIGLFILIIKNSKKFKALSENRQIELDGNILRVKSNKNHSTIEINLDEAEKIGISKGYGIPEESLKDIANEISGHAKKNFIEISKGPQKQKFEFIIESYYMLGQFENLIQSWTKKGYTIERI